MNWARVERERRDLREKRKAKSGDESSLDYWVHLDERTQEPRKRQGIYKIVECPHCGIDIRAHRLSRHVRKAHAKVAKRGSARATTLAPKPPSIPRPRVADPASRGGRVSWAKSRHPDHETSTIREALGPNSFPIRLSALEAAKVDRICKSSKLRPVDLLSGVVSAWLSQQG